MQILGASLETLRATRTSKKWAVYPADVLPVWIAEMDAEPCEPVVEAVTDALRRGDTGYPVAAPMAEAFAGYAARQWGWSHDPATAHLLPDTMIGIEKLIHTYVPRDGAVVTSPPCYDAFAGAVASTARRLVTAPLDEAHRLDPAALETAFADAGPGAAYLLCNPQNPTGTVHTADELRELARIADRHDVLVISDEIHAPLVYEGVDFVPYLTLPEAARGIAVVSGSKSWNLAGLRAALAVPGAEAAAGLAERRALIGHGAQQLATIAQAAVYTSGQPWMDQVNRELADRRRLLIDELAARLPEARIADQESTYLAWIDCSALGLDHPQRHFLSRGKVALSAGGAYDARATQYVRFNFATAPEIVTEAVARMAASV